MAEANRRQSPYVYCRNNPIRFIDPDGMLERPVWGQGGGEYGGYMSTGYQSSAFADHVQNVGKAEIEERDRLNKMGLYVSGSMIAIATFQYRVLQGTGGFFNAIVSVTGQVTLESTGKKDGQMSANQLAFFNILKDATDITKKGIEISLVESSELVMVGSYEGAMLDIDDVEAFGEYDNGRLVNSNGVFAHEIYEQSLRQRGLIPSQTLDHSKAVEKAENPVNGSFRFESSGDIAATTLIVVEIRPVLLPDGRTVNADIQTGGLAISYARDEFGSISVRYSINIVRNNVVSVVVLQ